MASSSSPIKKMIKLQTTDNQIFEVEESIMLQSQTIKFSMSEDFSSHGVIPLDHVTSNVLPKIIEYCTQHASQPAFDPDIDKRPSALRKWDDEFIKMDRTTLGELTSAAHYLDIKSLLHLASKTIADMLKDKTTEEIRQLFDIKNDFTPEEEKEIRELNQWAFE